MLKKKERLYKQAKRTKNWTNYRHLQKDCRRAFRKAEWEYIQNTIEDGLSKNDSKPFWRYIKAKRQDNIGVAPLKSKGSLVCESKNKADILVNQFRSVFTQEQKGKPRLPELPQHNPIEDLQIREEGVKKLLQNIKIAKAPGPDQIPNRILKECANELAPGLTAIFQLSVDSGCLPSDWTNANVSPVYKKGDKHLAENYRPVSLTSVPCKLLEHIICKHLLKHLEKNKILTNLNHGFRSGYSCETQLVVTLQDLCRNYDNGKQTDIAILDFSKAFDTVPHPSLLYKLQSYGVKGNLHSWLQNFLTKRLMRVVVDGEESVEVPVDSGVPQGTVLGPVLFLCHINDLPASVKSQVRLFADDCLLYRTINSYSDHHILQADLKTLEEWANTWGMRFNAKKCYILSIRNKSSFFYNLDNHILQKVNSNPYLGVTFTDDLSWTTHINKIVKKANSTLGLLRRNLRSCPQSCRRTAYVSLIRSTLEYSCLVWDPYKQGDIDSLENVQKRAARFITQNYRDRNPGCVSEMLSRLQLPPLQERRKQQRLTFLFKVVRGLVPAVPPEKFIQQQKSKRQVKQRVNKDFTSSATVRNITRNNSQCFTVECTKTPVYKYSFFTRTVIDWNNLDDNTIQSSTVNEFRGKLPTAD
ncbi:hypothetical protein V1264_018511 [Littorina saxatilis]|uniref:Reverse transcriptase domain-containing protein n=1 Tax=Littorina saxatilis TaxID=31220 RepID=A0AAN9BCP8_9CAEN